MMFKRECIVQVLDVLDNKQQNVFYVCLLNVIEQFIVKILD